MVGACGPFEDGNADGSSAFFDSQYVHAGDALYKAQSGGDYRYRGEDLGAYDDIFDQKAGKENTDLEPLVLFLQSVNSVDDATFAAKLDEHLDIDAFASYLAVQEMIGNFDDISGPGNNSYRYVDLDTGLFTVVAWDHNLAFGAIPGADGQAGGGLPNDFDPASLRDRFILPDGFDPANVPEGFDPAGQPEGFAPPGAGESGPGGGGAERQRSGGAGFGGGGIGGIFDQANILVDRFVAESTFEGLYSARLDELTGSFFASGAMPDVLQDWVSVLERDASDLVGAKTLADEADQISAML